VKLKIYFHEIRHFSLKKTCFYYKCNDWFSQSFFNCYYVCRIMQTQVDTNPRLPLTYHMHVAMQNSV